QFAAHGHQGVDAVGGAAPGDLPVIGDEPRLPRHRQAHHGEAMRGGGAGCRPMRRVPGGHQVRGVEAEVLPQFPGGAQVPDMDRVEGAAKDADAHGYCRMSPSPSTIHFWLVSPSRPTGPRAWILSVEMPISAPRPYSKPSAKRVEALTITELESTSVR